MLPNFLIVGAAKSGTTSLYHYFKQHPQIYMSPEKEPKFVSSQFIKFPLCGPKADFLERHFRKTIEEYETLFKNVKDETAIGEASADNLYFYDKAIPVIKEYLGNVKIFIVLRNPVERAFSSYTHFVRDNLESLSFEEAIEKEQERRESNWEFLWSYVDAGFYFQQVKAYLENFRHVRIYLFDELKHYPMDLMQDALNFLNVKPTLMPDLRKKYNISGMPKNMLLHNFLVRPSMIKNLTRRVLKTFISEDKISEFRKEMFTSNLQRVKMKEETRKYLIDVYSEDIQNLQRLIKKDLSHWLKPS